MTCNCDLCNKCNAANSQNTVLHLKYAYEILLHISIVHVMVTQQGLTFEDDFEYLYLYKILIRLQTVYIVHRYVFLGMCTHAELDI